MIIAIIIGIIIITLILYYWLYNKKEHIEHLLLDGDPRDEIIIPYDPEVINDINMWGFYRLIGIIVHYRVDKFNRILRLSFKPPLPDQGETKCTRVTCPLWFSNVACWKCK